MADDEGLSPQEMEQLRKLAKPEIAQTLHKIARKKISWAEVMGDVKVIGAAFVAIGAVLWSVRDSIAKALGLQ